MDAGDSSSDESQPLLDENNRPLLRRRSRTIEVGLYCSRHVFHAATKALRESGTGWLLIFMPLGIVFGLFEWNSLATLLFNIAAIIPLSALVSGSSDQLCDHIGELMGGLVNATFGNTVELIVRKPRPPQNMFPLLTWHNNVGGHAGVGPWRDQRRAVDDDGQHSVRHPSG